MTYVLDRQRSGFAGTQSWPMGFLGLTDAVAPFGGNPALQRDIEVPPAGAFDAADFAARLGKEWSDRRNGNPAVGPMTAWLRKDYEDTMAGARTRKRLRKVTPAAIGRAWAISRLEQMKFQLSSSAGLKDLVNFHPPASPVALVSSPWIVNSTDALVAPLTVRFVEALRGRYSKPFDATNYRGHGVGSFLNRGFSLDMYIKGSDSRGFFPPAEAIALLRAVHQASRDIGAEWRVLYNDFGVADAINRELGIFAQPLEKVE